MINIVGGTYNEKCFEPAWEETYGSGLRGCKSIMALDPTCKISYATFIDDSLIPYLESYKDYYENFEYSFKSIPETLLFYYDHPLNNARIFPRLDTINTEENVLEVESENILVYGVLEGKTKVIGKKVVYDPQSSVKPVPFCSTGSKAEELAIVVNWSEAKALAKSSDLESIKDYFFKIELAQILIIKMGPKGALISIKGKEDVIVPVYKTDHVWSIGSGDVFAAIFSYWWFKETDPVLAAKKASYSTAEYCNWKDFQFSEFESNTSIVPLNITNFPESKVYIAAPFFTFAQRWLIDQIRRAFFDMGISAFSPLHDVGYGNSLDIAKKDLEGLKSCALVFAVLDGLDAGTLFEIGYAISYEVPVVGFVQNESPDRLFMMEGTNCLLENDLTTAIYKSYWKLAENE